jgi:hypothetical protein
MSSIKFYRILLTTLLIFLCACTSKRYFTETERSVIEQLLLTKSADQIKEKININVVKGTKVFVDVFSLVPEDEPYLKGTISLWFLENGATIVEEKNEADYTASVLVKTFGTDSYKKGLGIPEFPVPIVGVSIPPIDLLTWEKKRGHTEVEIVLCDVRRGKFKQKTTPLIGKSHFSTYTILLIPISRNNIL